MGIGIREARNSLPTLIKRAANDNEDIQLGSRGADEVTLVATGKYERMQRELDRLRSKVKQLNARLDSLSGDGEPAVEEKPFAGLQRALEEGRLSLRPDDTPRVRTVFPDYTGTSSFSREERIRMGSSTPEPEYRRTLPRA
jgi:PHD/YefM family antitoxin component YafN of YafNO toxin-antitoxin module